MKIILSLVTALMFTTSCTYSQLDTPLDAICHSKKQHTLVLKSGYEIKIFAPNNAISPDIWEGPVCIRKVQEDNYCLKGYSLIKGIEIIPSSDEAEISIFSGSNSEIKRVKVKSCKEFN
ncbi:MAG: hypothetical protein KUG76_03535 [Gammaproteobacteria bacterium]|nr:hypothetical protein [Gammaproteobacteria bacterium]